MSWRYASFSAAALAGWFGTARAWGCPCSDDPASSAFLTRADEGAAVAVAATSRRALGVFGSRANFRRMADGESEFSEDILLRAALRRPTRVEWVAELGAANYRLLAGRFSEQQRGLGDAIFRARYALRAEDAPRSSPRWPALSLAGLLRAPLGAISASRASLGSAGAQLGLGAWELGASIDASRGIGERLALWLGSEVAYRFADHALGRARQLGPRLNLAAGARFEAAEWLNASLALASRWTGNVRLSGRTLEDTSERLVSVVLGLSTRDAATGLRSSLGFSVDPPLAGISVNSTAALALSAGLGASF